MQGTVVLVDVVPGDVVRAGQQLLLVESMPFSNASFAGPNPVRDFMAGPRVYPSRHAIVDRALALGFGPTPADIARSVELNTVVRPDGTVTWKYHLGTLEGVTVFDSDFSATWATFDALTVPVTLVHGTHGLVGPDLVAEFRRRVPHGEVIALDAGHNIHEEQPGRLVEIIEALDA
jgi:pimeloyl-ACP methyl ester carboxylesterase